MKTIEVTPEQAYRALESGAGLLVDVRSARRAMAGRVPGSVVIPPAENNDDTYELRRLCEQVESNRGVFVMSSTSTKAIGIVATLRMDGIENLFCVSGGFAAWLASGLPVEKNIKQRISDGNNEKRLSALDD